MENFLIYLIIIMKAAQLTNGVTICTLENNDYQILNVVPVNETNQTSLIFSVRSCYGVRIVFANTRTRVSFEDENVFRPAYFVSMANRNDNIRIRTCLKDDISNCFDNSVRVNAPDLLHCTEFRSFWISWKQNITLGKGNELDKQVLLTKPLDETITINFIGVRTFSGNNDTWILLSGHEILGVNEKLVSQCFNRPSENSTDISSSFKYSRVNSFTSKSPTLSTTATDEPLSTNGGNVNEISTTQLGLSTGKIKSHKYYSTTHSLTFKNDEISESVSATTEYTNLNQGTQSTTKHTIDLTNDVYVLNTLSSTDFEQTGHFITTDIVSSRIHVAQQSTVSSTENKTIENNHNYKCMCRCPTFSNRWHFLLGLNLTRTQLSDIMRPYLRKLKKSIEVNQKETNTYRLKHVCANDDRQSSKSIGLVGIIILCSVPTFFVTLDILGCFIDRTDKKIIEIESIT
ncbi:unnamed protein product [Mytilus edulis]|uniref:Farnesoic acid O-methyl transferase domain-containing protein n=1 Tax=Mytilus edulis TaxID=6550 RepID=A0A8S3PTA1_MYTED|nr:unnamed protein product [Mytilus edulis]